MKKKIKLLQSLKYFLGSIGAATIINDHKWIGISIMALGAACDALIMYYTPSKDEPTNN
jgi:hypothetical protein